VNLWDSYRARSAARQYAERLPQHLSRAYGASETYTAPQIARAVEALRLPRKYVAFAYAAYLPEASFNRLRAGLPLPMSYQQARADFFSRLPWNQPAWEPLTNPHDAG